MVLGYHLVWTAYGWWLPNDPRGSMSGTIESDVIAQLGELHYGRKRVQLASRDIRRFYCRGRAEVPAPPFLADGDACDCRGVRGTNRARTLHLLRLRNHARPHPPADPQAP